MKHLLTLLLMFLTIGAFAQTVTNTTTLDGSSSFDQDGSIAAYQWTKIAGPAGGDVMTNANSVKATVVYTMPGTYSYQLKVTDNKGATALDTTSRFVSPAANIPPHANAGADQSIQLPPGTTSFNDLKQIEGSPLQSVMQNSKLVVKQISNYEMAKKADILYADIITGLKNMEKYH